MATTTACIATSPQHFEAMRESSAMRKMLGDEFVTLYTSLKDHEYREFQEIITPYEREILMFNV